MRLPPPPRPRLPVDAGRARGPKPVVRRPPHGARGRRPDPGRLRCRADRRGKRRRAPFRARTGRRLLAGIAAPPPPRIPDLPRRAAARARSRATAWKGNVASAQYHAACRDTSVPPRAGGDRAVRAREHPLLARSRRASSATPRATRGPLAATPLPTGEAAALAAVLRARRTVREFRRRPVPLADFAHLLRTTFGVTGTLETDLLGPVALKTSPSAGALHPVEAYVIAWNVRGPRARRLPLRRRRATSSGGCGAGTSGAPPSRRPRGRSGSAARRSSA